MTSRLALVGLLGLLLLAGWLGTCVLMRAATVGEMVMPLEDQSFGPLEVVTVGTGSAYENPERLGPTTAVGWDESLLLVDAGRGSSEALRASGIPVSQPDTVLLTHVLPYNTVGLDDLLFTGWLVGREKPLRLIGPPGTKALAKRLSEAHAKGARAHGQALALPAEGSRFEATEVGDSFYEQRGELVIRAGALPGGPVPALAWRFERGDRSVVISGTGWAPEALIRFAQGADMLVHEAVYIPSPEDIEPAGIEADPERLRRESALHTSILEVGNIARKAGVQTLVLTRMRPPPFFDIQVESIVNDQFPGQIEVAEDGDAYTP